MAWIDGNDRWACVVALAGLVACGDTTVPIAPADTEADGATGSAGTDPSSTAPPSDVGGGTDYASSSSGSSSTDDGSLCGDAITSADELCDDGNVDDGDGCSADCSSAECFVPVTHPTIQAALDDPACPTVWLANGLYFESIAIARDVALVGYGIVSGGGKDRTVDVLPGVSAELRRLTVYGGFAAQGGGIRNLGSLTLDDVRVEGNDAVGISACGGGIYNEGELVVRGSSIRANQSNTVGAEARGAGICSIGGSVTLAEASELSENVVAGEGDEIVRGGGLYADGADVLISGDTELYYNRADIDDASHGALAIGGAVYQRGGTLVLDGARILHNRARVEGKAAADAEVRAEGAGIAVVDAIVDASAAVFEYNRATAVGTGLLHAHGGALHFSGDTMVSIVGSSFMYNEAQPVAAHDRVETASSGGALAIVADGGTVDVDARESTWAENGAGGYSMGSGDRVGRADGGAVFVGALGDEGLAIVRLERSTFHLNGASGLGSGGGAIAVAAEGEGARAELELVNATVDSNGADEGGGVGVQSVGGEAVVHIRSCTLTENYGVLGNALFVIGDAAAIDVANSTLFESASISCGPPGAAITSLGYNAFEADTCVVLGPDDITPIDIAVEPLADNGGPTATRAVAFDSPLRDAGDPAGCTSPDGTLLDVDQRGEPRHVNVRCDIGAFEYAR